ncbi:MAG: hypothetical protein NT085_05035 [candidate division SR1 bacterium]|nr:hypothetical protein [candidate division SR1 bacterium]
MSLETSNSSEKSDAKKSEVKQEVKNRTPPQTQVNYKNTREENDKQLQNDLNTIKDPNLENKLTSGKFNYDYLLLNQQDVVDIWSNNNTSDAIIQNIKEVVSFKINDYLKPYGAEVIFDKKNPSNNYKMNLGYTKGSDLFIDPNQIHIEQPKDLKSVVSFPNHINIFDINNIKNQPVIAYNGDMVEYTSGAVKDIGTLKINNNGSVEVTGGAKWGTLSGSPSGIIKLIDKNETIDLENKLQKISAKELLETGDGKLFDYIHDNWKTISDDAVKIFKGKIQSLYPTMYSGETLSATVEGGKKSFTGAKASFFFGT